MEKIIIKDESYVSAYYVSKYKVIVVKWTAKVISSEQYRDTFNACLDFARQGNDFLNFLSDTRNQPVIPPKRQKMVSVVCNDRSYKIRTC